MSTDDGDERERKRPRLCGGDAAPPPEEAPCCWVCHVEGPDDDGEPLRRDCSCRGGSGFAHLSCIVEYARRKSKKARDPSQFRDPWSSCSQCRQYYFGELALDVATEFVAFTEEKYPAVEKRLLEALSLKVWVLETIRPEEAKQVGHMIISRIEELRAENSSLHEIILDIEADTYNTIAHVFVNEGTAESAESAVLYFEKYMDIQKAMGATEAVSITESNIALAKSKYEGSDNTAIEEVVEKQRLVYQNKVAEHGERSHDAIDYGLDLFGSLRLANRTIEAERLLTKLIASSMRVHGPDHTITKAAENKLIRCKKRKVTVQSHEERGVFQALRYEEDGKKCLVQGPVANPRDVQSENTFIVASEGVLPCLGTPVICNGLNVATHLNGEIGDVRSWEEASGCFKVHFEDDGIEPQPVKLEFMRILFDLPAE